MTIESQASEDHSKGNKSSLKNKTKIIIIQQSNHAQVLITYIVKVRHKNTR